MGLLFFSVFISLVVFLSVVFLIAKLFIGNDEEQESNFGLAEPVFEESGLIQPAPREHVAYMEQQTSIVIEAIKKAPKTIMTTILIQLFLMLFTGYLSVQNIERLAMAGSALSQGDYGMAISALWPIGKDAGVEQWRVSRGNHSYLDENDLTNFVYIGKLDGKNTAIMKRLYSTQDHDEGLSKKDESYGNVLIGLSAGKAIDICEDKYKGNLISSEEWELNRGHFLSARNVKEFSKIPEWTRNTNKKDNDDFLVIEKESGIRAFAVKENIDREEDGKYIDGDDLSTAGFRCSITWEDNVTKDKKHD